VQHNYFSIFLTNGIIVSRVADTVDKSLSVSFTSI